MDRVTADLALRHFSEHPMTRIVVWVIGLLCSLLITVSTTFAAYYAGDMRDSIDELKGTVQAVVERVDRLERENEVRRAQWEAYREVYVEDVKAYRNGARANEQED
jgi:hypothetical protein